MTYNGTEHKNNIVASLHKHLFLEFKRGQIGYSTIAVIGQSCLGSAAVMMLLMGEINMLLKMILVFLVTIFCMAFNGAVLAQLKPLTIFNLLILSVVFSLIVIFVNLI